jgi:hypothetical protein
LINLWTFPDMRDNCNVDACGRDFREAGAWAQFLVDFINE